MFTVEDHGSLFLIRPLTRDVTSWLTRHTDATWFGGAIAVEPRYVDDLVDGMRSAGFVEQ
jgi:hypothetical protein